MEHLNTVFWTLMIISAIGVAAFLGTVIAWGAQFIKANRPVRIERHESIPTYYGRRVTAA